MTEGIGIGADLSSDPVAPDLAAGMPLSSAHAAGSIRPQGKAWQRFVAIGDSFTEGMNDDDPDNPGAYIGWADRLAPLLAAHTGEFHYANLAVRGRRLKAIAGEQTEQAIAMRPDLVSVAGGGNDILRPKADLDALAIELEESVRAIRATGADVLISTPSDPIDAPVIVHYRGRMATYTAHIWKIAQRQGCYVLNQWSFDFLRDYRMWSDDRIHMTTEGHRRVALAAYAALGHDPAEADWHVPPPPHPAFGRFASIQRNMAWALEYGGPWMQRRVQGKSSGDHVGPKRPHLTPLESLPDV